MPLTKESLLHTSCVKLGATRNWLRRVGGSSARNLGLDITHRLMALLEPRSQNFMNGAADQLLLKPQPALDVYSAPFAIPRRHKSSVLQYLAAFGAVTGVTLAAFGFTPIVGAHATALVFLLAVVLLALLIERGPTLFAAALSALCWEYFFLPPTFTFRIHHFEDAMLFGMYFVVALVLGQLTTRIRSQQEVERRREERATALFLLTRELSQAADPDQLISSLIQQTASAFEASVAFLELNPSGTLDSHRASGWPVPAADLEVAGWVFHHGQMAGKFTSRFPGAAGIYVALAGAAGPVAVLGLQFSTPDGPSIHQQNLLHDFSHHIALALDRHRLNQISEKARLLAESERLSKTLLDSMSHEMRTPLAAIRSATGTLVEMSAATPPGLQQEMLSEIEEATQRLDRLVGNVIEASRLESGLVRPRLNECDVIDLIQVSVSETERQLSGHRLTLHVPSNLPLVPLDFVLMQSVITNLLSNAALHTPPGTSIELTASIQGDRLILVVSDNGPGIPPSSLPRLFDKFYRTPNAATGGTGLGLSLVKGFVEAHQGGVKVENRPQGGSVFTLWIPLQTAATQERSLP